MLLILTLVLLAFSGGFVEGHKLIEERCADPNAEPQDCPSACQPTCSDRRQPRSNPCTKDCLTSGCVCKSGYMLDEAGGICIEEDSCPSECSVPDSCKRTCANPNPDNCVYEPSETNVDSCNCVEGYILSDVDGQCIRIEECPSDVACNGDPNAEVTKCPSPCPATCDSPNEKSCKKQCEPVGCKCFYGYILDANTGFCVLPDNCPSGNPCSSNEQFVSCKFECSNNYCPTSDSRDILLCNPPPVGHCRAGCICNLNYRRKSTKDSSCIISSNCRPVKCTRPNEVYDRNATSCVQEDCSDYGNNPVECNELVLNNNPRCVCQEGYYRNETDICIPGKQCPTESID